MCTQLQQPNLRFMCNIPQYRGKIQRHCKGVCFPCPAATSASSIPAPQDDRLLSRGPRLRPLVPNSDNWPAAKYALRSKGFCSDHQCASEPYRLLPHDHAITVMDTITSSCMLRRLRLIRRVCAPGSRRSWTRRSYGPQQRLRQQGVLSLMCGSPCGTGSSLYGTRSHIGSRYTSTHGSASAADARQRTRHLSQRSQIGRQGRFFGQRGACQLCIVPALCLYEPKVGRHDTLRANLHKVWSTLQI